jgi:pyruvate/2-oxoglutarate dehydrogenase complex dihydrolipoamide dehydrogenase (E3) component
MDYHLIIIGGGAAGKDAELFAARAGIKTLLVEKDELGGTSQPVAALPDLRTRIGPMQ